LPNGIPQKRIASVSTVNQDFYLTLFAYVLLQACFEFFHITWGTGLWLGEFSSKWGLAFFTFVIFCAFCLLGATFFLSNPKVY